MHFRRVVLSFCCIVVIFCTAHCKAQHLQDTKQKDHIEKAVEETQSNIYKIKRLDKEPIFRRIKSTKKQKTDLESITPIDPIPLESAEFIETATPKKTTRIKKLKGGNSHGLNKKLLNKLGFKKVKAPNSHNRKRLAVESRRHASPDDSHMFIIKLPPSEHYYSSPKANGGVSANSRPSTQNALPQAHSKEKDNLALAATATATTAGAIDNGKKVSFPFSSNGRPGRIYHWNLPIIQQILEDKQRFANIPNAMKQQLIDIKDTPTWNKPWENETIEKSYGKSSMMHHYKKSLKRKSPSYYAPANTVNKNSFNKYFAGNGKPKGFYVIKENQKKPLYYKNIVS